MKLQIQNSKFVYLAWLIAFVYLIAFGIAEFLVYNVSPVGGIVLYFATLTGIIVSSTFDPNKDRRRLWLSLGLGPLIRIVSIVMPVIQISAIYWYFIISLPIFLGIYTVSHYLHYTLDDIGLNSHNPLIQLFTAITGIGLGVIDYYIVKSAPLAQGSIVQLIFPAIVLIVFNGIVEELAFRGVMQKTAILLGSWGWIFVAAIYAVLQIGYGSILQIFFIFAVAIYFGFVVKKTNSILGVSLAHGLMSIMVFLVMPKLI